MSNIKKIICAILFFVTLIGCVKTDTPPSEQSWWEYGDRWVSDSGGNWPWHVQIFWYGIVVPAYYISYPFANLGE